MRQVLRAEYTQDFTLQTSAIVDSFKCCVYNMDFNILHTMLPYSRKYIFYFVGIFLDNIETFLNIFSVEDCSQIPILK